MRINKHGVDDRQIIKSSLLSKYNKDVYHFFGTKEWGNIDPSENDSRTINKLIPDKTDLILPEQIHSSRVVYVEDSDKPITADGLITRRKKFFLGIKTADCAPIFLYAPDKQLIANLHGGWKGITSGIIDNCIDKMDNMGASINNIKVVIGPSLKKCCFEIGEDILDKFDADFVIRKGKQFFLDFGALIVRNFKDLGVRGKYIEKINHCTKCTENLFYSYRRDKLPTGRMLNIIGMK